MRIPIASCLLWVAFFIGGPVGVSEWLFGGQKLDTRLPGGGRFWVWLCKEGWGEGMGLVCKEGLVGSHGKSSPTKHMFFSSLFSLVFLKFHIQNER